MELQIPSIPDKAQPKFSVIMPDGEKRVFTERAMTAGVLAWSRRLESLYRKEAGLDREFLTDEAGEIIRDEDGRPTPRQTQVVELSYWVASNRRVLNDFLREVFSGDHSDIDWYDQDGASVLLMVSHFFFSKFGTNPMSKSVSSLSSAHFGTTLQAAGVAPAAGEAAATSGSTTKRPRKSRKAPKTSTTS